MPIAIRKALLPMSVLLLSGCSHIRDVTMPPEKNLLSGAGSIIVADQDADKFEQIEIAKLLEKYELHNAVTVSRAGAGEAEVYRYRRNDMQDYILAASNQKCGYYLREIVSVKSQTQMGWGGLALLLAGAASVTTPASAARILSAGAAVSTGVNSLTNEAYFNNLAVNVISAGITKRRDGIFEKITASRQKPLADYPVNAAIADAVRYHSACNIISGLEAAAAATANPGTPTVVPR